MVKYDTAEDDRGRLVSGELEADSLEAARPLVENERCERGEVAEVDEVDEVGEVVPARAGAAEQRGAAVSADEAEQLTRQVADLSIAGLPLAAGLRAAAEEAATRRLAATLRAIAGQVEQGRSLEDALQSPGLGAPAHVSGLIRAARAAASGAGALDTLVEQQRAWTEMRREVIGALGAYPISVLAIAWPCSPSCRYDRESLSRDVQGIRARIAADNSTGDRVEQVSLERGRHPCGRCSGRGWRSWL